MQTAVRHRACMQIAAQPASLCLDLVYDLWQRYLSEHIDHGYIDYDPPGDNQGHNYTWRGGLLSYDQEWHNVPHNYKLRGGPLSYGQDKHNVPHNYVLHGADHPDSLQA